MTLTQPTCTKCSIKLGFTDQPAAFFHDGLPYCQRHIDKDTKAIIDAAQRDADDRKLYEKLKLRDVSYETFKRNKAHYLKNTQYCQQYA